MLSSRLCLHSTKKQQKIITNDLDDNISKKWPIKTKRNVLEEELEAKIGNHIFLDIFNSMLKHIHRTVTLTSFT
jgi:hypothetical protein